MLIKTITILVITVLGAFGSFYFKIAALRSKSLVGTILMKELYIGGVLYLVSILLYILALKDTPLSILLPQTALTYVWSMTLSFTILKEKISRYKIIGAGLILLGSIIVAASNSFV